MIVRGFPILPEFDHEVQPAIFDLEERLDDSIWARRIRLPFTWQRFINWWVCRRWLQPRDVRKR